MRKVWKDRRIRFLIIGGLNTLIGYATFTIFFSLTHDHLHYWLIAALSHTLATVLAFFNHRTLVFHSTAPVFQEFLKYSTTTAGSFLIGLSLLTAGVELLSFHPIVAQGIAIPITLVISYLVHKNYSFANATYEQKNKT